MLVRHYLAWACVVACGALGARALIDRPEPPRVVTVTAPPTVIAIAVPAPAPPAPPPAAPVPAPAPVPSPHVGCGDVTAIGLPAKLAPAQGGDLYDVSVSSEGCVIAARVKDGLAISWDGGATFARMDVAGKPAAAADRVAVLLDDGTFGTIVPGKPLERHAPRKLGYSQVVASGRWTALTSEILVAVTDDHGVSWRYLEPPKDAIISHIEGDRMLAVATRVASDDGDGMVTYTSTTYETDLRHPAWHAHSSYSGTAVDEEARYALTVDQFWGCGESQKLLESATGAEIAGGLRDEVWPLSVHSNHGVTFAGFGEQLYRLTGGTATKLDGLDGSVVGVDAAGTPIVLTGGQLLRWSKAGGWRVLLDATP